MIKDPAAKQDIVQQWGAVKTLCKGSHRQHAFAGGFINETPPDNYYNLPLVLAFAVLDQALGDLIAQGTFTCKARGKYQQLGDKMPASLSALKWLDYALVEQGKAARNDLAHKAQLVHKDDCFKYIGAIEAELVSWGVL